MLSGYLGFSNGETSFVTYSTDTFLLTLGSWQSLEVLWVEGMGGGSRANC